MPVKLTGDWLLTKRLLAVAPMKIQRAWKQTLQQEAHQLRKEMIRGITQQAPGGAPFQPLSEFTRAIRKFVGFSGTKALIRRADLRNSINVIIKDNEAFVGIPRKARAKGQRRIIDIAKVHEFGAGPTIIPKTPKMRAFIMAVLAKAGIEPSGKGSSSPVVIISIPARPFIRPAFQKYMKTGGKRFLENLSKRLDLRD